MRSVCGSHLDLLFSLILLHSLNFTKKFISYRARFLTELFATDVMLSWTTFKFTQIIKVLNQGEKGTQAN